MPLELLIFVKEMIFEFADFHVVPLAQLMAALIRYKCENRLIGPSAPLAWDSQTPSLLYQLVHLFDIAWPTEWGLAPGEVGEDLALVALHGLALGLRVPLLFMVPFGYSQHRLPDSTYAGAAVRPTAAFANTAAHWADLIQPATADTTRHRSPAELYAWRGFGSPSEQRLAGL